MKKTITTTNQPTNQKNKTKQKQKHQSGGVCTAAWD